MQYQNNELILNDEIIRFSSKIFKVTPTKSNIFVLLGFDFDTYLLPKSRRTYYVAYKRALSPF